jgi:hypothetical protein
MNHSAAMEAKSENTPIQRGSAAPAPRSWLFRMLAEGRRTAFFWSLQVMFWCGIGVMVFLMNSFFHSSAENIRGLVLMRISIGLGVTGCLREIYRRPEFRNVHGWNKMLVIVGLCLAFSLVEKPITLLLMHLDLPLLGTAELFQNSNSVVLRFITLLIWSGFYVAFHYIEGAHALEQRTLQAELVARENQLRHLQAQINPHFLFNALNTVIASKEDPKAVGEVTQVLADYLRFSLSESSDLVPLAREMDALESYLTLQRIRFGEKLVCQIQCDTAARAVQVPPMMIQPLLENAFNYGAETSPMPLQVKLSAQLVDRFLNITVANTGRWLPPDHRRSPGSGLRSLKQRLQLLIDGDTSLETEESEGWVKVTIRIPLPGSITSKPDDLRPAH